MKDFDELDEWEEKIAEVEKLLDEKKYVSLRALLSEENAADIAEIYGELQEQGRAVIYRLLPKDLAAEVFVELSSDDQAELIRSFSDKELKEILDELYMDDTADLVEEMPAGVVDRILRAADAETRADLNMLLRYPKDSAGSLMTTEFILLKENLKVSDAFEVIRRDAVNKETVYTCYVTDASRHLIGLVSAKDLLLASPETPVSDIMNHNVISIDTLTDKEEVGHMFDKYNFFAMPVVDKENRLVGIITIDDAIDVLHDEAEEDFAVMAAITPTEEPYLKMSPLKTFLTRIPWLLLLMISATFTGMIISGFESALSVCVVLTAFIPMLMDTGGNSGSQASVTVIRGLSLGEIDFRDVGRVVLKELSVAVMCGLSLAAVAFGKILLVDYMIMGAVTAEDHPVVVAAVVAATLFCTVICAKLIGCTLPILAKRLGFDPAVMASPFITTVVDAVSLLLYFGIASHTLIPMLAG